MGSRVIAGGLEEDEPRGRRLGRKVVCQCVASIRRIQLRSAMTVPQSDIESPSKTNDLQAPDEDDHSQLRQTRTPSPSGTRAPCRRPINATTSASP